MALGQLIRAFQLNNARIIDARENPYTDKVPAGAATDAPLYRSALGTPVYTNVVIQGADYIDEFGVTQSFADVQLDNVLVTASQSKNIVKTQIQGRNGTVKEYIGKDDFAITIQGAINAPRGQYPLDAVKNLKRMLDAPIPLAIASWWLQNLDIDTIVVEDYDLPQTAGEYSTQYFTINCLSDSPIELKLSGGV